MDGECLRRIELPMISGGMTDLKGSQNGKFHGIITEHKKMAIRCDCGSHKLTESGSERLMCNDASLALVSNIKGLVL